MSGLVEMLYSRAAAATQAQNRASNTSVRHAARHPRELRSRRKRTSASVISRIRRAGRGKANAPAVIRAHGAQASLTGIRPATANMAAVGANPITYVASFDAGGSRAWTVLRYSGARRMTPTPLASRYDQA